MESHNMLQWEGNDATDTTFNPLLFSLFIIHQPRVVVVQIGLSHYLTH